MMEKQNEIQISENYKSHPSCAWKIHMVYMFRITYGTQMLLRQIYVMVEK